MNALLEDLKMIGVCVNSFKYPRIESGKGWFDAECW